MNPQKTDRSRVRVRPGLNDRCWCGSGRKYKRCHRPSELPVRRGRVSARRSVLPHIGRPEYAETGRPVPESNSVLAPEAVERVGAASRLAAELLDFAVGLVREGVTTEEIDAAVHKACVERGAYPSPLNYKGYPKSICTSVNEVVCHGIPDDRALCAGDIVNVDVTAYYDGVHGDTDATFAVGVIDEESAHLLAVTRECLYRGIEAVRPGGPLSEIGLAIESHATAQGCGVVRTFGGHGIGERFHTDLHVPHYYDPRAALKLEPGMVFTIEPMITLGSHEVILWADGWTAVTVDGLRSAQFEHTVLVTESGAEVLTGSKALPAQRSSSS